MPPLNVLFETVDALVQQCEADYELLKNRTIDAVFFEDIQNQRLVNSFLFNYMKLQDKIGAKLFRAVLWELREIDDESMPMRDILNRLEKLQLIEDAKAWDRLREVRNAIAHEYPLDIEERVENIAAAMQGYGLLKTIYAAIRRKVRVQ